MVRGAQGITRERRFLGLASVYVVIGAKALGVEHAGS